MVSNSDYGSSMTVLCSISGETRLGALCFPSRSPLRLFPPDLTPARDSERELRVGGERMHGQDCHHGVEGEVSMEGEAFGVGAGSIFRVRLALEFLRL